MRRPTPPTSALPTLDRPLQELLVEMAVTVHKRAFYPSSHPILRGAVDGVYTRVVEVLQTNSVLAVGVAERRLLVDGASSDEDHPLLSEFALRLNEHQVGAFRLSPGVSREEVDAFLAAASQPVDGPLPPLGQRQDLKWNRIVVEPIAFDRLAMLGDGVRDDGAEHAPDTAWEALAAIALSGDGDGEGEVAHDPLYIARAIERRAGDAEFDASVIEKLSALLADLDTATAAAPVKKRERLADLIGHLSENGRQRLMEAAGKQRGHHLVRSALGAMGARAVLDLVRAASKADAIGVSNSMLRLLEKLSTTAETSAGVAQDADRVLRSSVRRLLEGWTLVDPNPELYSRVLGEASGGEGARARDKHRDVAEPERIVDLSLETGVVTPSVQACLGRLVMRDGLAAVIERLQGYPETPVRELLVDRLLNEASLREYLMSPQLDMPLLRQAVDRMRGRAFEPLYTALEVRGEADAPALVELIVRIGWDVLEPLGARVEGTTPRLLRHLIAIFDELEAWPPQADPVAYARHPDVLVRREAIKYLLRSDHSREQGTLMALRDSDVRVFSLGLAAIARHCPPAFAREAMRRFDSPTLTTELRVRLIRAVASSATPDVRQWLSSLVLTRRWLFGSMRLRKPTPETIAVLSVFATMFPETNEGKQVLALAASSRTADYRRAIQRVSRTTAT